MRQHVMPGQTVLTIEKQKLIDALKQHREQHKKDYEKAVRVYFRDLQKMVDAFDKDIAARKFRDDQYTQHHQQPMDNTAEYDKHIGFLEMAAETELELTIEQYDCYINDEWDWISHTKILNATYSSRF